MARPPKNGLDYYPQDTDIHNDRKIRRLITEFGGNGYLVYDYIKCLCYRENGYWLQYDDGFCFDVADVLKAGTTENSVLEILKGCFRMSLFNSEVFKAFRIITSAGIQKRYLKIKKNGVIKEEIRCFSEETAENNEETTENSDLSTQSKEKESKIKEKKMALKAQLEPFRTEYGDNMLLAFLNYWGEADKSGSKLRWEMQKTWELKSRLRTWANNDLKFKQNSK